MASLMERIVTPKCFGAVNGREITPNRFVQRRRDGMKKAFLYAMVAMIFAGCSNRENVIVIGSKDFTEQLVIGNILQILVDENTDLKTKLVPNLSSNVIFAAIKSGDVHLYVEYSGTIYSNYFGNTERRSPQEVLDIARTGMEEQHGILVLGEIGFNNTNTLSVRQDTAERYGLRTISDLITVAPQLTLGATGEFTQRPDAFPGVRAVYGIDFKDIVVLAGNLRYTALANDSVQVMDAYSTDGLLMRYGLVILEDDRGVFPYYHAVPIIRRDIAEKYPQLVRVLNMLSGTLNEEGMRWLNYRVDVDQEEPRDVARSFLLQSGLIKP